MRRILYVAILAALFFAPLERADVAKLLPIQAVAVYTDNGQVVLETDAKAQGRGDNAAQALANLKTTTAAVVYLDTAEYLLVSAEAIAYAEELRGVLKPSVRVCICDAAGRVSEWSKYLDVHGKLPEFRHWKASL